MVDGVLVNNSRGVASVSAAGEDTAPLEGSWTPESDVDVTCIYETPLGLTQQLSSFLPQRGVSAPWSPGFNLRKPQRRIMWWVKIFQFTSNLVCLKRTEAVSQLIYKEIFLHHPRTWSSSGLKVHCGSLAFLDTPFPQGVRVRVPNLSAEHNQSQQYITVWQWRSLTARYALSLTLSCAASGSWSVWSVGCPQSQEVPPARFALIPPHNKEKALPEQFLPVLL